MAVDKIVDGTALDNNLTSVANAIRTKGGTSGSLSFPSGFVSAINAIGGGADPSAKVADNAVLTYDWSTSTGTTSLTMDSPHLTGDKYFIEFLDMTRYFTLSIGEEYNNITVSLRSGSESYSLMFTNGSSIITVVSTGSSEHGFQFTSTYHINIYRVR